jgi:FAD/FMN-containing dehydrogenase
MSALEAALAEWRSALGEAHVLTDPAALASAETATFTTTQRIPAIVRPSSTAEVQACLRIAQGHRVPVYPVSGGRNWGYGSRVPPRDGCVLMELGRMDRILAYDEQLAYLTVEPGVTFRQAYTWLKERGSPLFITTIGGSPDSSLVGNALERGDGRGPHADIFNHVCGLEVVLPNGERVETGLARFPQAHAAPVYRWGLGPSLDGLFSQSALGVVTRMTFWLVRKAPYLREFVLTVKEDAQLWELVERLQALALDGTLRNSFFIWNDVKALSVMRQFPFEATGGSTPLPGFLLEGFREEFGRWAVSGAITAQDEERSVGWTPPRRAWRSAWSSPPGTRTTRARSTASPVTPTWPWRTGASGAPCPPIPTWIATGAASSGARWPSPSRARRPAPPAPSPPGCRAPSPWSPTWPCSPSRLAASTWSRRSPMTGRSPETTSEPCPATRPSSESSSRRATTPCGWACQASPRSCPCRTTRARCSSA